ncbi:MAG: S1C family serine protease [Myxococcota bacterium]
MTIDAKYCALFFVAFLIAAPQPVAAQDADPDERADSHATSSLDLEDQEKRGLAVLMHQQAYLQKLHDKVAPSVIFITRENGAMGTGFFVDGNGLALTHARVVGDQNEVDVHLHDGRKMRAPVVERTGDKVGLALVDVAVADTTPLLLTDTSRVQSGSWLGSIVHGFDGARAVRSGHLSAVPSDDKRDIFQLQMPMNPSASGAPIFDVDGHVIGVADAAVGESRGINLGIRSDKALESLAQLRERCICLRVSAPEGKPIFVDGRIVGKGPEAIVLAHPGKHEVFSIIEGRMKKTTIDFPREQRVTLE